MTAKGIPLLRAATVANSRGLSRYPFDGETVDEDPPHHYNVSQQEVRFGSPLFRKIYWV